LNADTLQDRVRQAGEHHRAGRRGDAEALCREILAAEPSYSPALHVLALMAQQHRRFPVARKLAELAVAQDSGNAEYHHTLGTILGDLRDWIQAAASIESALRLRPRWPQALHNLGNVYARTGQVLAAAKAYREALACRDAAAPEAIETCQALIGVYHVAGDLAGLIEAQRRLMALRPDDAAPASALLYSLHYDASQSSASLFAAHQAWAGHFGEPLRQTWRPHRNSQDKGRRLRIGYVSAVFSDHPVTRFQREEMEHRDRDAWELTCYSNAPKPDATTDALRDLSDRWRDVSSLDDEAMAKQIRDDQIDILVDLDGHDQGNRLLCFARRPAPVQVTCNGYVDTTGMSAMDWRLTDADLDPPGTTEGSHTEKLYRVSGGAWCYRPDENAPSIADPPMLGNGFVTFGSLNRAIKHTPETLRLWSQVLAAVSGSRLVVLSAGHASTHAYLRDRFAEQGIDPQRLEFLCRLSRPEYLRRLTQLDIALDPFPFAGVTTTCDALHMGVPVVSLLGDRYWSRAGAAILPAIGLGELLAHTHEQYVAIASQLARNPARLLHMRRGLRERLTGSTLCDGRRHSKALSKAYRAMWHGWCDQQSTIGATPRRSTASAVVESYRSPHPAPGRS
jgi:predicted O-linked N-acetylglucosamine transferase (SPINDLY family)